LPHGKPELTGCQVSILTKVVTLRGVDRGEPPVPRRNADTRDEIRSVALELFATHGVEQTSLRQIAERLDITKAALYYHFPSKDELIAELAEPLIDDLGGFLTHALETPPRDVRGLLSGYLDLCHQHRLLFQTFLREPAALARLGVLTTVLHRRTELDRLLVGSDHPADRARAIIAFGGLQDCAVLLADEPLESYRESAIASALRALQAG
jgi:AcrR family transcriptional regulator